MLRGLATLKMKQKSLLYFYSTWTVGSICPNTKEEEKEQQEEDQRAKPQRAKPQSPPNPPTRIHCTNGNYAYLTEAVLWGQGGIVRTTKNGIDMEIKLMRERCEARFREGAVKGGLFWTM